MPGDIHVWCQQFLFLPLEISPQRRPLFITLHHILAPSVGSPRAVLTRISSLFQRPHSHTNQVTELQQTQRQGIFSHRGSRTVEVAAVRDNKILIPRVHFSFPMAQ